MTRGTAYILLPYNRTLASCEFDGDMYPGGNFELMVEFLSKVQTEQDFRESVAAFDRVAAYGYQNMSDGYFQFYNIPVRRLHHSREHPDGNRRIDLRKKYIERFFSDYIFFLNKTGRIVNVTCAKVTVRLRDGEIGTFYFGKHVKTFQTLNFKI